MTVPSPPLSPAQRQKRRRLARGLGGGGMLLNLLALLALWGGAVLALAPTRAALQQSQSQLAVLENRLAQTEAVLVPLQVLGTQQAQEALGTLSRLTHDAQSTPLLAQLLGEARLTQASQLLTQWQTQAPHLLEAQALGAAREQVRGWQTRLGQLQQLLSGGIYLLLGLLSLLGLWNLAGQWALWRWGGQDERRPR